MNNDSLSTFITDVISEQELNTILILCSELTSAYDESHNLKHHIKVCENALMIARKTIPVSDTNYKKMLKIIIIVVYFMTQLITNILLI